jgi:hypothetical protein
MKSINFLLSLICFCAWLETAGVAAEDELSQAPEMSPAKCAQMSPTELYKRLCSDEHRVPGIDTSEGGQDNFCFVYQRQLQKYTDAHYPRARSYRKPMTQAFLSIVYFIEEIYGHDAIKHLFERSGADVEWIIFQAEKSNYKPFRESYYGVTEIEQMAQLMANGSDRGPGRYRRQAMPHLYEALKQFSIAVQEDSDEVRSSYFAHELIKFMANLL